MESAKAPHSALCLAPGLSKRSRTATGSLQVLSFIVLRRRKSLPSPPASCLLGGLSKLNVPFRAVLEAAASTFSFAGPPAKSSSLTGRPRAAAPLPAAHDRKWHGTLVRLRQR